MNRPGGHMDRRVARRRCGSSAPPGSAVMLFVLLCLFNVACGTRLSGDERAAARAGSGQVVEAGSENATGAVAGGHAGSPDDAAATGPDDMDTNAAASGGGTNAGSSDAGAGGSRATPAATGEPIVLGTVGTFSGPAGAAWGPNADMLEVWARDVNDRGGIDGHPVRMIVVDDGGDPSRHFSVVRDLVENKGVLAFLGNATSATFTQAMRDYLEQRGVPVIGGSGTERAWDESPVFFPIGTSQAASVRSHAYGARDRRPEARRWGQLTCRESQACRDLRATWAEAARSVDFEVVYQAEVSIAQPDFTAECLGARSANVEVLAVAVDPNSIGRLAQACSRQNFHPTFLLPTAVVASTQDGDANLKGAVGILGTSPWMSTSNPGNRAMHAAVKRYAPNRALNMASTMGWAAGLAFEEAVRKAGGLGSPVDRQNLFDGLHLFAGETLGGVAPPLTFRAGQPDENPCWFTLEFIDDAWTAAADGRHACP